MEDDHADEEFNAFLERMRFFSHLKRHIDAVWRGWDLGVSVVLSTIITWIFCCTPTKDIVIFLQSVLPPMTGILATLIAFVFAGLIFFVSFGPDDTYVLCFSRNKMNAYDGFLFLFRWAAAIGGIGIISALCLLTITYSFIPMYGWIYLPLLIVLFFFVYTILTIMNLFGTMTRYGVHKISFYSCNNTENETPNDADENTENEAC